MTVEFKKIVVPLRWERFDPWPWPFSWFLLPSLQKSYEFRSFVLGYRWTASDTELALIRKNELFGETALTLREGESPIRLMDVLGPSYLPEIGASPTDLMHVEIRVRQAAQNWEYFLKRMTDE